MKKRITLILFLLMPILVSAQVQISEDTEIDRKVALIKGEIKLLQAENLKLNSKILNLNSQINQANSTIKDLTSKVDSNKYAVNKLDSSLSIKIIKTGEAADLGLGKINNSVSEKSLYGIIAVLLALVVSFIIYWLLSNRQKSDKHDIVEQLSQAKNNIEENIILQFGKHTELMESQLKYLKDQKNSAVSAIAQEPDHSLALKLSGQINIMENNLNRMDQTVKGIKPLRKALENLKDNLAANGYEMPVLLGKQFHQGMKIIVVGKFPDDTLAKGEEIITKVLIPQVNYNDKMIQTAQIEVSEGL